MRAQTRVDRHLVGAIAGPGRRVIPIKVGHGGYPWLAPALAGAMFGECRNEADKNLVRKMPLRQMAVTPCFASVTKRSWSLMIARSEISQDFSGLAAERRVGAQ